MKRDFGSECMCVCMCVLVNTHKLVIYKKKIIIRALKGMELNPFFFFNLVFRNFYQVAKHLLDVFIPSKIIY